MFNVHEFRSFLYENINYSPSQKNSIRKDELIDAMCQFDITIQKFLNRNQSVVFNTINKAFYSILNNKPKRIAPNKWIAHLLGYYKCIDCKNILSMYEFTMDNSRWNNLCSKCKTCVYLRDDKYRVNNLDKDAAKSAKRRATRIQAAPLWLTKQHLIEIKDIYYQAQEYTRILGEPYHIDHIIPLRGITVSGLHVPWNLQIITEKENLKKGNNALNT